MLTIYGALAILALTADAPAFPNVQVTPLPGLEFAFEVDDAEIARYCAQPGAGQPYIFPLIGPAGRRVTRMGHPHDPNGHCHHRSIWIGHRDINGINFWEDGDARITHERIEKLEDGPEAASLSVSLAWRDPEGRALLNERRTMTLRRLAGGQCYLDIALEITPAGGEVTLGKTPFGFLGVRVAKSMSVHDGGGQVRNSEGGINEPGTHWKPAHWVDYSGRVTPGACNGITVFDHPSNPRFPTHFHVRDDGWMGAAFNYAEPLVLKPEEKLALRYRLYVHDADATPEVIEEHWKRFSEE